jgi:tRNA (Thr-GGU) A37 N-methylase
METIELKPIGIIRTPYTEPKDMPIQGRFRDDVEGWIELNEEYVPGLQDLDGFSHLFLIYYFHRSDKVELEGRPYLEDETHGIFAIRSPHRQTTWDYPSSSCNGSKATGCTSPR